MVSIFDYPDEGKFNIRAVSQKTDILAVTIRAWERRYSLLEPKRALNGYRMYSERDIAVLNWVKKQIGKGISISSVAAEFQSSVAAKQWPEAVLSDKGPVPSKKNSYQNIDTLTRQLTTALVRIDERMAADIFSEAMGAVPMMQLFELVLIPVLVEIGVRWERGEISVAVEHFASSLIQGKVQAIYQSLPLHPSAPKVIVGCAPDELHQIGSLMFAVLLRDSGYRVEFLGPDIPLEDLARYAGEEKPRMLIISATLAEQAEKLVNFSNLLEKLKPRPLFGFGGAAFTYNPELIENVTGVYLGRTFHESIVTVKGLVPMRPNMQKR